ncbi:MAG: hypothetical protein, partial [Bacteriophage sp.]
AFGVAASTSDVLLVALLS